jgi:hypothetical protein
VDSRNPDIVIYLIQKGADYKRPLYPGIKGEDNYYITNGLREWRFDIGSNEYQKKMQIVDFLAKHGMFYSKTKTPERFLRLYDKQYLEKY